ncbi:MAG: DUF362 domain-containing protein [Myxococcota bacterium]|nr:DUF362 domain-containing protein [Myxococcota bacterium]
MKQITTSHGTSQWATAWTRSEINDQLHRLLNLIKEELPTEPSARIVIKPNLNNDLNGLTGNSVDLRVLDAIVRQLKGFGYHNICIADGPNVGIERRGIDVFKRLGVRALCTHHGIELIDLNSDLGIPYSLAAGAQPRIARSILDADYIISVPKIKTHCEAMLSCAMKNWVGICVGQDKRDMHLDLGQNIALLNTHIKPNLIIVDGIIGMEGNGPGDGTPIALKQLIVSTKAHLNDLVVANLMGLPINDIPYLMHAISIGDISETLCMTVSEKVDPLTHIKRPPPRPKLALLSEHHLLYPLKVAVRPLTEKPEVLDLAYQLGIVQDVYHPQNATVQSIKRHSDRCGECTQCVDLCPTEVPLERIGKEDPSCILCLQCWWACPTDALEWFGTRGHLHRHITKYRPVIRSLFDNPHSK